jgi:hypothetical protein
MINENLQTVVDSVNNILNDTNLADTVECVIQRLVSFGYEPTEDDAWIIAYSIKGTVNHIKNETNQMTIPDGLFEIAVDMACGEMLNAKLLSGQLDIAGLDLSGMVQSVKEGDTQVTFSAAESDEAKFKELLSWVIRGKGSDLICYRRMRW